MSYWQKGFIIESLVTFGGLILDSIAVMAASPFSKQGIVIPLDEYIIFTSIKIFC
jgi:hypothetical protein